MTESNVFDLSQPGTFCDPLTEVLRSGARTSPKSVAWYRSKMKKDGQP